MTTVQRYAQVGFSFGRTAFLRMLAYRVRYLVGVINYFLYVSVHFYILMEVKRANGTGLGLFDGESDILTYLAIAWASRAAYFNSVDQQIAEQVANGNLAMDLIRPSSFPWMKYAEIMGETIFRLLFMSLPVLVVLWAIYFPSLQGPGSLQGFFMFLVSLVLGFHLYFVVNFLTGLIAIVTKKIQGFLWAKFLMVQLLSGVMLPLAMFPSPWDEWLTKNPFAGLGHTPVLLYMGKLSGAAAWEALAWQAGWTLLCLVSCAIMWRWASRHVTIQGG